MKSNVLSRVSCGLNCAHCEHPHIFSFEFLVFRFKLLNLFFLQLNKSRSEKLRGLTNLLVTLRTVKRLFPFRTQKLSPHGRW